MCLYNNLPLFSSGNELPSNRTTEFPVTTAAKETAMKNTKAVI